MYLLWLVTLKQECAAEDDYVNLHQDHTAQHIGVRFHKLFFLCVLCVQVYTSDNQYTLSKCNRPVNDQNQYFLGMKYTSAMFAASMYNILPAITFLMVCIFRYSYIVNAK